MGRSGWLLAAAFAQALRLARQPIAGGRLIAVVAVLGHPRFQLLHAGYQRGDLLPLVGILGLKFCDACCWCHVPMLRLLCKCGCVVTNCPGMRDKRSRWT